MRTARRIIIALMLGATPVAAPGFAFDGAPVKPDATLSLGSQPAAAQAVTAQALKKAPPAAQTATATAVAAPSLNSLQYAAEGGHPVAQWKLGRMYADGDGVAQDDLRAFDYFSRIANQHAEDSPSAPQAGVVANAFVALGRYYLVHQVEEMARHAGHADIIREQIDSVAVPAIVLSQAGATANDFFQPYVPGPGTIGAQ